MKYMCCWILFCTVLSLWRSIRFLPVAEIETPSEDPYVLLEVTKQVELVKDGIGGREVLQPSLSSPPGWWKQQSRASGFKATETRALSQQILRLEVLRWSRRFSRPHHWIGFKFHASHSQDAFHNKVIREPCAISFIMLLFGEKLSPKTKVTTWVVSIV